MILRRTPSPDPHVLWVLQPSPLVVEEKVLPVHAKHAPELNPSPGGQVTGAGHVDLKGYRVKGKGYRVQGTE